MRKRKALKGLQIPNKKEEFLSSQANNKETPQASKLQYHLLPRQKYNKGSQEASED
jgi:hypothetical protein